jgi:hypothetical protein
MKGNKGVPSLKVSSSKWSKRFARILALVISSRVRLFSFLSRRPEDHDRMKSGGRVTLECEKNTYTTSKDENSWWKETSKLIEVGVLRSSYAFCLPLP